jgi:Kef-type K+ transport system membrane component KefB
VFRAAFLLAIVVLLIAAARSFLPHESSLVGSGASLAFGFVLIGALQSGTIVSAFRLPKITGYLLMGFLVGPSVFDLVTERMLGDLKLVNNVAVGLIALSAGAEINFKRLRPRLRAVFSISLISLPLVLVTAFGFIWLLSALPWTRGSVAFLTSMSLGERAAAIGLMAIVAAALSPTVVLAIINEVGAAGAFSEVMLGTVVVADLMIIFGFAGMNALAGKVFGSASGGLNDLLVHIFGSLGVGLILGLVFVVYLKRVGKAVPLFAFAACFVCAEAGTKLHLDPLLTCLTAGMFLENLTDVAGDKLVHDIEPARLPVFAVFFAVAGAGLHWDVFRRVAPVAIALSVVRGLALFAGGRIGAKIGNMDQRLRPFVPAALYSQSGIAIGLSVLIEKQFAGSWGPAAAACMLGSVMINEMVGPVLFRRAMIATGEAGAKEAAAGDH